MNLYTWLKNWWNNTEHKIENKYGWIPDKPDPRDYVKYPQYANQGTVVVEVMPESVDLRPQMPDIYDQQSEGSCTANGIARLYQFLAMQKKLPDIRPRSRNFIYYNERAKEGTINSDSGASPRDGFQSLVDIGACSEDIWPYDVSKFTWKPSADAYNEALKHRAIVYKRVFQRPELIRLCLSEGIPFGVAFTVYDSFESQAVANTGIMPIPDITKEKILGGHYVVVCGYLPVGALIPGRQHAIVANSWGKNWGDKGYFYMDFEFLCNPNFCNDLWCIESET